MSTRATYQFSRGRDGANLAEVPAYLRRSVTLYIHYDGYPEGAASYFYAMLCHENQRGFGPEAMLRAVEYAELTTNHEDHGDTDFRYFVAGTGPTAMVRCERRCRSERGDKWDSWRMEYEGTLADFIDRYFRSARKSGMDGIIPEDYTPFRQVELSAYGGRPWLNQTTARARLHARLGPLGNLRSWKGNGWSANWESSRQEVRAIVAEFPELGDDEISELVAMNPNPYGKHAATV